MCPSQENATKLCLFKHFRNLTARAKLQNSPKQCQKNFEGDHASVQTTVLGGELAAMPTFHDLSTVKWGATRARAPLLCIASTELFSSVLSPFAMPLQHPNTGKQADLVGLGPYPIFRFFHSVFSTLGLRIPHLPFWGGRISEEIVPQHRVYLPTPRPLPNPKPLTQNSQTQWNMQPCKLIVAAGFSKLSINVDTDVCVCVCFSTEAKGRSGQRTEALGATQHAGQAWTAIKRF